MDELLRDFITETNQHLEEAATQLVLFERDPSDASLIAKIFRLVHTIKGTCSFLGLNRLQHIAHAGETMIGELRNGAKPTQESVTAVLAAIDRIKQIVEGVEASGVEPEGDDSEMIAHLTVQAELLAASLRGEAPVLEAAPEAAAPLRVEPQPAAIVPDVPEPAPASVAAAAIDKVPAKAAGGAQGARSSETIRVAVDAIERMMQLVSELVLTRNQLLELTRHRQDDTVKSPLQRLSALTTDLQDAVMRARMQPVERLYANLPRLIRELSTELGKKINLVTEGADTELDRQLIEILRDPLTHMIRNSADHGLETPADRVAAGKPETGEIRVSASHEAGQITISIGDDGRGLDIEKIKKKLVGNGTASEQALARMSEDEIFKFIFAPGFSTAKTVTNVSGRGVGMDVVRSNIESIGGSISMQSAMGRGTKFSMRIPLTLAIAPALIVEASGQRFALPQHAVVEAVGVGQSSGHVIDTVQNALVLRLREDVVPVMDMSAVLGLAGEPRGGRDQLVVIMRVGGETFGVIVDKVADVQEVVVKPLSASLSHLKIFTGHTILGDGSVVLILDPGGLAMSIGIEKSGDKARETKKDVAAAATTRLVLFRAGRGAIKVLPVALIARIEMVDPSRIEEADGQLTMIHQGRLMPILPVGSLSFDGSRSYPVLVITDGDLTIGLMVDEILDIIEETLDVQLSSGGHDTVGAAVVRGHAVEFIDVTSYLQIGAPTVQRQSQKGARRQVLLVHDDAFARDFLSPMLAAAGYRVTAAASAAEALQIIDQGSQPDAVVTRAAMGQTSAGQLRDALQRGASPRTIPMIGLVGAGEDDAAGDPFTLSVAAHDRHSLLAGLSNALQAMQRAERRDATMTDKGAAA